MKLHLCNIQSSVVNIWTERVCEIAYHNMQICDVEFLMERVCEIAFIEYAEMIH